MRTLSAPQTIVDAPNVQELKAFFRDGHIVFDHVDFSYESENVTDIEGERIDEIKPPAL